MGQFNPNQLPEAFRKRMAKPDRKELGVTTMDEVNEKQAVALERELHHTFDKWLYLNGIPFVHSTFGKRATTRAGTPDYIILKGKVGIAVEFKVGNNSLSEDQNRVIAEYLVAGVPVAICTSVEGAIEFCKEYLKL